LATALWLGFLGACIGSFLNVVAYRLPRGISIVWKPSHCPQCHHPIRPRDNVPVLGWLMLHGRCRDCGQPISPRYAIVEFVMGLVFFVLAYVELFSGGANLPGGPLSTAAGAADTFWNPQWQLIAICTHHAMLLCLLMAMLLMDQDRQSVPRRLTAFALAVAVAVPLYYQSPAMVLQDIALGGATGWFLGWLMTKFAERTSILSHSQANNFTIALAVVGVFLGWQAALLVAVCSNVVFWILGGPTALPSLWTATLLLILFRKQIADITPW